MALEQDEELLEQLRGVAQGSGAALPPVVTVLISFRDGSYKKVRHIAWKHSQWIHFTLPDGSTVACNPANVNYLHIGCGD